MSFTLRNLSSWLTYLETLHPKAIDLGLDRVGKVAHALNLIPFNSFVITVAGTNGKGSCVALSESILSAAGYRVGAYTSPHLLRYNERVRINGEFVTDEMLCKAFVEIEKARGDVSLTYFEFGTLAALLLFKQANLDVAILEVGMGGRLDATNIIDADIAIISSIALDHTEWLGNDREAIGFEKAGIMRAGKSCVCGDFDVPQSIRKYAQELRTNLYCPNEGSGYSFDNLPLPKIAQQNAATVLKAIELLPQTFEVNRNAIKTGLKQVFLPGRFQIIGKTILDVAHNPAAGELLAKNLQLMPCSGRTLAVVGMLSDKDILGTIQPLFPHVSAWYVGGLDVPRGAPTKLLADQIRIGANTVSEYISVTAAYRQALADAQPSDRIIVFGSFYTVAEVMQLGI